MINNQIKTRRLYKVLSILVLISMILQPVVFTLATAQASPNRYLAPQDIPLAPSESMDEMSTDLTMPSAPNPESMLPDLNPQTWAFDEHLSGLAGMDIDSFTEARLVQIEPLVPDPAPSVYRPARPEAPNPVPDAALGMPLVDLAEALIRPEESLACQSLNAVRPVKLPLSQQVYPRFPRLRQPIQPHLPQRQLT